MVGEPFIRALGPLPDRKLRAGRGEAESIAIADQSGHVISTVRSALTPADEEALSTWLADPAQSKVCHGAKEYWHGLHGAGGFELNGVVCDTVLAAYLLHPDQREYDLHDLALRYLGVDIAEGSEMLPGFGGADGVAHAAAVVVPLSDALTEALKNQGEDGALLDLELAVSATLQQMEKTGIHVSEARLEELREDFHSRVEAAAQTAYRAIGHEVNLSSPKQLQAVLFDELGLPKTKKTKSGYTTNAEALSDLAVRIAGREDDQARRANLPRLTDGASRCDRFASRLRGFNVHPTRWQNSYNVSAGSCCHR